MLFDCGDVPFPQLGDILYRFAICDHFQRIALAGRQDAVAYVGQIVQLEVCEVA